MWPYVAFAALGAGAACTRAVAPPRSPLSPRAAQSSAGSELIGSTPPEWQATHWLNSKELTLAELRGKVVLVRWWTAGCPYCATTAPSLREFDRAYRDRGLVVVGFYHHKDEGPLDERLVDETSKKYGFLFPVAIDPDWTTLDRWWQPKEKERPFTSVSFLIDRRGAIRHIHPGGEYAKGEPAYDAMKSAIESLLAEP
jgi:peroxiredoxin